MRVAKFRSLQKEFVGVLIMGFLGMSPVGTAQEEPDGGRLSRAAGYTLEVGDVVTISVWKNENLGATVPVRPDGRITVPLVGEIEVIGKRPEEAREALTEAFAKYVTAPAVSVVVNQINSWKVYVIGEVRTPGVFDIVKPTRLVQVLAMAGGFTEFAKENEIVVLREQDGVETRRVVSVRDITSGRKPDDNLILVPGDTVIVP